MVWEIGNTTIKNRLLLGTAQYPSLEIMQQAVSAAKTEIITVSLKRQDPLTQSGKAFWNFIKSLNVHVLPNTAGCRTAKEAIILAQMAREIFQTTWIKLEVIGDDYNLQPDSFELLIAARELIAQGFEVLPYCIDDLIVCQRLYESGCRILMPWGSPIGSGQGLLNPYALQTIRHRLPKATLIIDAGIGRPSDACLAMEFGFDAVLLNSAVAKAADPIKMARAFAKAIRAGRTAYHAGIMAQQNVAQSSTPLIDTPFWKQEIIYNE